MAARTEVFTLFNTTHSNLAYINTLSNNITVHNNSNDLKTIQYIDIQPTTNPKENIDTGININITPELEIYKYTTLQLDYTIESPDNVSGIRLDLRQGTSNTNSGDLIVPQIFLQTNGKQIINHLRYFTESIHSFTVNIIFTDITSTSGIIIKDLSLFTLEGDQMLYESSVSIPTYNQIEVSVLEKIKNTETAFSGHSESLVELHEKMYMSIYNPGESNTPISDLSGIILSKEFVDIDYPDYDFNGDGLNSLTTAMINYSQQHNLVGQNNLNVPIGYNYLLTFIFNDITFTHTPTLELSNVYGNFNTSTYYDTYSIYDNIVMGAGDHPNPAFVDISGQYNKGFHIKLKIPSVSYDSADYFADVRNCKHYIVKKIHILFIKFHNAMFDYFYNHVDLSGNTYTEQSFTGISDGVFYTPPLSDRAHAPTISNDGSNKHTIFEFIRHHTILHYQSMIINDVLNRYCDVEDLGDYLKENTCDDNTETDTTLSIEFIELIRLLAQFDQNEVEINSSQTILKHNLYNTANFTSYGDQTNTSVSGIMWGNLFKCMESLPQYSKKLQPYIFYSTKDGDSIVYHESNNSNIITDIGHLNPYFYFANMRLTDNSIASGQKIRSLIINGKGEHLCDISKDLFKSSDIDGVLEAYNALEFTPYIYYILYECSIYTRGRSLASNGIASNILLKNMMKCFYNSIIDYTKLYLDKYSPLLFDFNSGGVDISGNIRIGIENKEDYSLFTVSSIYMRDIIRAATSSDPIENQHYHIITLTNSYSSSLGQWIEEGTSVGTPHDFIYISKSDYIRMQGFKNKLYTTYADNVYTFTDTVVETYDDTLIFKLKLEHQASGLSLPNKKFTLTFFSIVL